MDFSAIVRILEQIPDLQLSASDGSIDVYIPAIDDCPRICSQEVRRARRMFSRAGLVGVEFMMERGDSKLLVGIMSNDVAFSTASTEVVLDSDISFRLTNDRQFVSYSEMQDFARWLGERDEQPGQVNLAPISGSFLELRCMIAGAIQLNMRPRRTVALWLQGWAAFDGYQFLPPFRADPVWDSITAGLPGDAGPYQR